MSNAVGVQRYGWKKDLSDQRDFRFSATLEVLLALPPAVDLRPLCPAVLEQGDLGSCTANCIANAHKFAQMKDGSAGPFTPSRLQIYYNERAMEGTINSDAGASLRNGIKSIANLGVAPEPLWPYDITKFTVRPSDAAYAEALLHQAVKYQSIVQTPDQLKGCLATGYPFVFGFTVYSSFESKQVANTGVMPVPGRFERVLGGHAVLCVGYDDSKQSYLVMNSWGIQWGIGGFFWMPYAFMHSSQYTSDQWTLTEVEITDQRPRPTPTPAPSGMTTIRVGQQVLFVPAGVVVSVNP